jgi:hypothetical protein
MMEDLFQSKLMTTRGKAGQHLKVNRNNIPSSGETAKPSVTSQADADNSQGTFTANNPDGTESYGDNQYQMQI